MRHRLVVGALFAVVIAFSLVGAKRTVVRTSFDDYFLSDAPMLLKTNEFKSIFGNDYYVAVLVRNMDILSKCSLLESFFEPIIVGCRALGMETNKLQTASHYDPRHRYPRLQGKASTVDFAHFVNISTTHRHPKAIRQMQQEVFDYGQAPQRKTELLLQQERPQQKRSD